uniref:Transmembrane protein 164 n=2 Tax=Lepeophtheirus salmonis TaxID=72036 RepID=D3PIG0_LEPSM|nr:Transmembrane protein 164 [Lepeophtheirus salmonis]
MNEYGKKLDMNTIVQLIVDISVGGINKSDISEGGSICWHHVPLSHRFKETLFGITLGVIFLLYGFLRHSPPKSHSNIKNAYLKWVTFTLYVIFIVEIGYKIVSKQVIFLWMPCHLITICQIYLLTSLLLGKETLYNEYIFRIMLHFLHGPFTALLFPVTDCLRLPYEVEVYWIQHFFILCLTPLYLMKYHFNLSNPGEFSWSWSYLSYGIWMLIHWIILHGISLITSANVGSMLCPASSDPFAGKHYRLYGICHQLFCIILIGQIWSCFESYFLRPFTIQKFE